MDQHEFGKGVADHHGVALLVQHHVAHADQAPIGFSDGGLAGHDGVAVLLEHLVPPAQHAVQERARIRPALTGIGRDDRLKETVARVRMGEGGIAARRAGQILLHPHAVQHHAEQLGLHDVHVGLRAHDQARLAEVNAIFHAANSSAPPAKLLTARTTDARRPERATPCPKAE